MNRPLLSKPASPALPRLRSVEASKFLEHQMYFWGKDLCTPNGNMLLAWGAERYHRQESPHAVSCYALKAPQGRVVLHSTGVQLQPADDGMGIAYLRPAHRLYHVPSDESPLPCANAGAIGPTLRAVKASEFPDSLTLLLGFVRDYETWASARIAPNARLAAWREHRRLASHGVRWLMPQDSRRWLDACLTEKSTKS